MGNISADSLSVRGGEAAEAEVLKSKSTGAKLHLGIYQAGNLR